MRKIAIACAMLIMPAALADQADRAKEVESRLRERYPATKITAVRHSPIAGLYEVIMGRNVAYSDESGRYMIFGHLYDMQEQRDVTAETLDTLNRVDVSLLPLDDAIRIVQGNGSRTLYVFSDPDCPYCKRLEPELARLRDVTIYTFPYPLDTLHPDARRKAEAIWCAKDRAQAWRKYMLEGVLPKSRPCGTPVDRNIRLGVVLGIGGTPTIIFGDGTLVAGMLPAPAIEHRLEKTGQLPAGAAVQR